MNKLKFFFQLVLLMSFGILLGVGIQGLVDTWLGIRFVLEWHFPISVIITSILCSGATLLLLLIEYREKRTYYICLVFHAVLLFIIVCIMGYVFHWYTCMEGFVSIVLIYLAVHVFVRIGLWFLAKKDEAKINQVLKDYSDKE